MRGCARAGAARAAGAPRNPALFEINANSGGGSRAAAKRTRLLMPARLACIGFNEKSRTIFEAGEAPDRPRLASQYW